MTLAAYTHVDEHLAAELAGLRLALSIHVERRRARFVESPAGQLHSFVTASEMTAILRGGASADDVGQTGIAEWREQHRRREAAAVAAGVELPLVQLADRLSLTRAERDLAMAVVAPELAVDVQRAYRHAFADFTVKHGSPLFFEELLGELGSTTAAVHAAMAPGAPLFRLGLLRLVSDDSAVADAPPSLARVMPSSRFVRFVRGAPLDLQALPLGVSARLSPPAHVVASPEVEGRVLAALAWAMAAPGRRVLLHGAEGSGRRTLIARSFRGLMEIDARLVARDASIVDAFLIAAGEARARGLALHLSGLEQVAAHHGEEPWARVLFELVRREPGLVTVAVERAQSHLETLVAPAPGSALRVSLPMPGEAEQAATWRDALPLERLPEGPDVPLDLARRYALTPGKIRAAAAGAIARAEARGGRARVAKDDLDEGVRALLTHDLGGVASRVETPFGRADLILPADIMQQIDEVLAFYRQRPRLLYAWGFDRILAYGRGVSALFSGPPGTGKTMAAGVLARELGLELFQVDLSQVVDKYIGETEKKMARIFEEAGRGQAILLFDEADSIFARRTEVKSSTDRYANLGVNFLLQRMESYEGITILTTNLESSIDDAFKRRIRFKVGFPMPDEAARVGLWRAVVPAEAPQERPIDFRSLAREFDLVGADIKNIAVKAAAIAAESNGAITTESLRTAARQLYRDRGKLVRA